MLNICENAQYNDCKKNTKNIKKDFVATWYLYDSLIHCFRPSVRRRRLAFWTLTQNVCLFVGISFCRFFIDSLSLFMWFARTNPSKAWTRTATILSPGQIYKSGLMLSLFVGRMSGYGGVATQDWRKGGGGRQDYSLQSLDQDWINVTLPHLR